MPFTEYVASEALVSNSSHMNEIWDVNWREHQLNQNLEQLARFPHLPWIQKYLPPPARILEAGCGLAKWVRFLDTRGYETYGIDFSSVAIENSLKIWPDLRLAQGDLRSMPYPDNFFDGIMSLGLVEHNIDGPQALLRDMRRVLRPGGILYCSVPCYNLARRSGLWALRRWVNKRKFQKSTGSLPPFFEYLFTPREYSTIMTEAGFELLRVVPLEVMGSPSLILGVPGSRRRRAAQAVHQCWPWLLPHMMAAICRRPLEGGESKGRVGTQEAAGPGTASSQVR